MSNQKFSFTISGEYDAEADSIQYNFQSDSYRGDNPDEEVAEQFAYTTLIVAYLMQKQRFISTLIEVVNNEEEEFIKFVENMMEENKNAE